MQVKQYFAVIVETNATSQRASDNKDCRSSAAPGRKSIATNLASLPPGDPLPLSCTISPPLVSKRPS